MLKLDLFEASALEEGRSILDFWLAYEDPRGGFYGYSDFKGNINKEAPKGVLLHSRILYAFSNGYLATGDRRYLKAAEHCYRFLSGPAYDSSEGGVYWMLDAACSPTDTQKHVYNQGFAIYALSEYYLASGDASALKLAKEIFGLVEEHCYDKENGGYLEAFDRHWDEARNDLVCDTAEGVLAEKSMNTHLHVLEAYTKLYEACGDELCGRRMEELALLMCRKVVMKNLHFGLFFSRDWKCVSHDISFGHDIEGSWLMDLAAALCPTRSARQEIRTLTLKMAEQCGREAFDSDGALFNEFRDGHLLDADRIWWVQAEGMVGFMNAFEKNHEQECLKRSQGLFDVIKNTLKDRVGGEWFWKTNRAGKPYEDTPKVEPWKCPYHNSRACFEICRRVARLKQDGLTF
ncbi:MAG: AGE family epimerase/isomerase [Succinivibrio sp.]